MKKKPDWKIICMAIVCFVAGGIIGAWIAVCAGNNAHSTDFAVACADGSAPDKNGCCPGEVYTDMGDLGFNCCPSGGGNCFPPIR